MSETLQEYFDSRGTSLRVDRDRGVIQGVKVLGLESRNGRRYLPEALAQAVALYEGAKVNVNHPKSGPLAPRDYQDRLGTLRDVRLSQEGLYGDLHFNPKHVLVEQLLWDAEHAPENVGLSHNVQARTAVREGQTVVESILHVQSVDLVADPATTRGLFETQTPPAAAVETQANGAAAGEPAEPLMETVRKLRAELDEFRAREAATRRRAEVERLVAAARLPSELVTEVFVEQCLAAADETRLKALIEDRSVLARAAAGRPRSIEQLIGGLSATGDPKEFATSLLK